MNDFDFWDADGGNSVRVMVLGNVLIGDAAGLLMQPELMTKWQLEKIAAVSDAIESGVQGGVDTCIVAGNLFHDGFVPDSLLRAGVEALTNQGIRIVYMASPQEALGAYAGLELPGEITLHLKPNLLVGGCLEVLVSQGKPATVSFAKDNVKESLTVRPLEPSSFDAMQTGYIVVDIEGGKVKSVHESSRARHMFVTKRVRLDHMEDRHEMRSAVIAAIENLNSKCCLRLILEGPVPPSSYVNHKAIAEALKDDFFYVEVLDETTVDVGEDELDGDVSLAAEFIRVVNSDDSLSPEEKTRIIRCGLNALNGRGLVE